MIHLLSFHYVKCQQKSNTPCARPGLERTVAVYVPERNLEASKACNLVLSMYRSCIICCPGMMRRLVLRVVLAWARCANSISGRSAITHTCSSEASTNDR